MDADRFSTLDDHPREKPQTLAKPALFDRPANSRTGRMLVTGGNEILSDLRQGNIDGFAARKYLRGLLDEFDRCNNRASVHPKKPSRSASGSSERQQPSSPKRADWIQRTSLSTGSAMG
jgi:hypothetical protein